MKISAKGKYGLAAMIYLAENATTNNVNVLTISEELGISKIYLEQVFSLLKKAALVNSIKGSNGGYQLSRKSDQITVFDILNAIEFSLFEPTDPIASKKSYYINNALETLIWPELNDRVIEFLKSISLSELTGKAIKSKQGASFMYYI